MSDQVPNKLPRRQLLHTIEMCCMAGLGGMLPTLAKLAGTYVTEPWTPMPEPGLYFGLALFFVVGMIVYRGLREGRTTREAIIVGIAAPALITNILFGASEAQTSKNIQTVGFNMLVATAYAEEHQTEMTPDTRIPTGKRTVNIKILATPKMMTGVTSSDIHVSAVQKDPTTGDVKWFSMGRVPVGGWGKYSIPEDVESLRFTTKGTDSEIVLPKGTPMAIIVVGVKAEITWWNDFLWAMGYKRKAEVTVLTPTIEPEK